MTNTQPKVSILVNTYQHGRLIEQCLQSLLAQETNFPYEIVIGEDGSTDGTLETCQTYAKKYPDIIRLFVRDQRKKVYLYGKATGKYNLLQTMLDGRGEYFAFCEGDDYWTDPLKIQKQADFMDVNQEYSFCATDRMVLKDGILSRDTSIESVFAANGNQPVDVSTDNFFKPYIVKSNVIMFRKSLLDFDLLSERYTQVKDIFIYFQLLVRGKGIVQPWNTGVYRLHEGGRWSAIDAYDKLKLNHYTLKGMFDSYLREAPSLQKQYAKSQQDYVLASLKEFKLKTAFISIAEHPLVFIQNIIQKVYRKVNPKNDSDTPVGHKK
jgi:glycosyltransferase involved in cell wall biosynthesis